MILQEPYDIIDKLAEALVNLESDKVCEEMTGNNDYCEQNCNYSYPQKECWIQWAKEKIKNGNVTCSDCILDLTDACSRGAGRAVNDEVCEDFIGE